MVCLASHDSQTLPLISFFFVANGQIALKLMSRGLFQNTDDAVWRALTVTLQRQGGALGFNIMGGFTVSHGRVAEKVTGGGGRGGLTKD